MDTLSRDVRIGVRMLFRSRAVTAIAILTLALGIGANTALFSVVNGVLFRVLPFEQPEQLVRITGEFRTTGQRDAGLSVPELFDFGDRSGLFEAVSGLMPISANLTEVDEPERIEALLVDVAYFSLLRVEAQLGRVFQPEDFAPGIAELAVISDGLWRRRYGADPGVIGRSFRIDADLYRIVGVAPRDFRHPGRSLLSDVDVWAPAGWTSAPFAAPVRRAYLLQGALGRLKPGLTLAAAQARLDALAAALRQEHPADYPEGAGWTPRLVPLRDDLVGGVRRSLLVLLGAVGCLLLIACANVASLMLARASGRTREIAIRRALGASRARLVRQLMTESVVLSLSGGALGLVIAPLGVRLLLALGPADLPRRAEVVLDGSVLGFTLALSMLTGILFGLAPAVQAAATEATHGLGESARGVLGGSRGAGVRRLLVASELALAVVLLVGATLLARSFRRLQEVPPGFDPERVLSAGLWLPQPNRPEAGRYFTQSRRAAFCRQVLERLAVLPGVAGVGAVSALPLGGDPPATSFTMEGEPSEATQTRRALLAMASPRYFEVMRIPVVAGRVFGDRDDESGPPVAIVSRAFARRFYGAGDPIGRRLRLRPSRRQPEPPWLTIVGVVGDVKAEGLDAGDAPQIYVPLLQDSTLSLSLVVRTEADPVALTQAVAREVRAADPDQPVYAVRTLDQVVSSAMGQRRLATSVLGLFAVVALLLAAVGTYGVTAYTVSRRTGEIGLRMALGARPADILALVLREGLAVILAGTALGLWAAAGLTRILAGLLYGVSATDPLSFGAIAALLAAVALVACYVPARRAAAVDPLVALRDHAQ